MAAGMATRSGRPLPGQDLHLPEQHAFARHTEWTKHPIEIDVGETRTIRAGDFDGDGDPDLLGTSRTANQVIWYQNPRTRLPENG